MGLPVVRIFTGQLGVGNDEQVFGVALLRCFCEVEAARDDDVPVDHDDFVVGNRVRGVDEGRNAGVCEKGRGRILLRSLALVENHLHVHAALVRFQERFCDGHGRERICLHYHAVTGALQLSDHGIRATTVGREGDLDSRTARRCLRLGLPGE